MPLVGFVCPNDKSNKSFEYCLGICGECHDLPFLYGITHGQRKVVEGQFSTTTILKPQLQVRIERSQPYHLAPEDLAVAAFGTAFHNIISQGKEDLHKAGFEEYLFEKDLRFGVTIETDHGPARLTGQADQYNTSTNIYTDYKTMKFFYDGRSLREGKILEVSSIKKHYYQTNIYRRHLFPECRRIQLFAFYKDYTTRLKKEKIPPFETFPVPIMPDEEVDEFVKRRMSLHLAAEKGEPCLPCNDEERYYQPKTQESLACMFYCSVRSICPIRANFVKTGPDNELIIEPDSYPRRAPKVRTKYPAKKRVKSNVQLVRRRRPPVPEEV